MAQPIKVALPPDLELDGGCIVRVTAIDPTTGNTVAGVTVANVSIFGTNLGHGADSVFEFGPFMLVPGPGA